MNLAGAQTRSGGTGTSSMGGLSGGSMGSGSSGGGGTGLSGTFFGSGSNPLGGGGGTGGGGFSGFSGGTSGFGGFSGGGLSGGGFTGTTSTGISNSNPFYSYFATPLAFGISSSGGGLASASALGSLSQVNNGTTSVSSTKPSAAFGLPVYRNLTGTGTTGAFGGTGTAFSSSLGGRSGGGFGGFGSGMGASSGGLSTGTSTSSSQAPRFTTGIGFPFSRPAGSKLQTDAQKVLATASLLDPNRTIKVALDKGALVLQGTVSDDHDRRLAEALVRSLPGVRDVVNQLKTHANNTLPQPAQGGQ